MSKDESVELVYKAVTETRCKLCYRVRTDSAVIYIDAETGKIL